MSQGGDGWRAANTPARLTRRLQQHLMQDRTDVQNIDVMILAGFCRNCLSKWHHAAARVLIEHGASVHAMLMITVHAPGGDHRLHVSERDCHLSIVSPLFFACRAAANRSLRFFLVPVAAARRLSEDSPNASGSPATPIRTATGAWAPASACSSPCRGWSPSARPPRRTRRARWRG